jgi:flagellar basal body-associated protein FliL
MSANSSNDVPRHCPALEAIIVQAVSHATEQELRANKVYVELKKQLKLQTLLCAEYR